MNRDCKDGRSIEILLVEDNLADVRLTAEALKEGNMGSRLNVCRNGIEAMAFLKHEGEYSEAPRPDLILLDLNLPRMDGRDVLTEIKSDDSLGRIPVVILTTSLSEDDIIQSYDLRANCYIQKPVDLEHFIKVIHIIEEFWFKVVALPPW